MLWKINIKDKMSGKVYRNVLANAENREDAVVIAMRELGKRVGNPHHFIEYKG